MNAIENKILTIHSEKEHPSSSNLIMLDLTMECNGHIVRQKFGMRADEWELAKKNGYYIG